MGRKKIKTLIECDICQHTVRGYTEFEKHRSYFHEKDVEKILEQKPEYLTEIED